MIKKGDKLVCTNASGNANHITDGFEYTAVTDEFDPGSYAKVMVTTNTGAEDWFYASRFRLASDKPAFSIPEDLKTGMLVEFEDGMLSLVMKDTEQGDNYVSDSENRSAHHWSPIKSSKPRVVKVYGYDGNHRGAQIAIGNRRLLHEFQIVKDIQLTADYVAKINPTTKNVTVGCQTIPFDKVEELYNEIKKHK